jgi:hypothetical protein
MPLGTSTMDTGRTDIQSRHPVPILGENDRVETP